MALWMVRAGQHGEREEYALENNVVIIGWGEMPDLGAFESREDLHAHMRQTLPGHSDRSLANRKGQLWRFAQGIEIDDIVALPRKNRTVAFGRVTDVYRHVPDAPADARHQRLVEWLEVGFPRDRIDSDLRRTLLDTGMMLCKWSSHNAEARIRAMLEDGPPPIDVGPAEGLG